MLHVFLISISFDEYTTSQYFLAAHSHSEAKAFLNRFENVYFIKQTDREYKLSYENAGETEYVYLRCLPVENK